MNALPLISCLMVTGKRPGWPRWAIAHYLAQTYPRKELVIVDHGEEGLAEMLVALGRPDIVHVRVATMEGVTLGDLRNLTLAAATGEYVAQWDDDDWYSERRLQAQYDCLGEADACFLWRLTMAWPKKNAFGISHKRMWEPSMLAKKSVVPRYPSLGQAEDTAVVRAMIESKMRIRLLERPELYVYVVHGSNTCAEPHFERLFRFRDFQPHTAEEGRRIAEWLEREDG